MDYSGFAPLSDSARARLQANVDKWHSRFKAAVRVNYPIDDEYLEGQTFEGEEAVAVQMASGIVDSLSDALLLINE
jgi:ClpP class serine protease